MSSKGKPLFDLNEPAAEEEEEEEEEENEGANSIPFHPQRAIPSFTHTLDLFTTSNSPRRIINNHAFSHASSVSGFQPFIRSKQESSVTEKEEGEWSDPEKSTSARNVNSCPESQLLPKKVNGPMQDSGGVSVVNANASSNLNDVKDENGNLDKVEVKPLQISAREVNFCPKSQPLPKKVNGLMQDSGGVSVVNTNTSSNLNEVKGENGNLDKPEVKPLQISAREVKFCPKSQPLPEKVNGPMQDLDGVSVVNTNASSNLNEVKGENGNLDKAEVKPLQISAREVNFCPESQLLPGKVNGLMKDSGGVSVVNTNTSSNLNELKGENGNLEYDIAMDNLEDSRVAPKQQEVKGFEAIHALKLANNPRNRPKFDQQKEAMLGKKRSRQTMFLNLEDVKQVGTIKTSNPRRHNFARPVTRTVKHVDMESVDLGVKRSISQNSIESKAGGKKLPSKKQSTATQYQDTSVERLLREVTNENFWQHPEEAELECVPGSFESVDEYVRVFEPLLFEECRAQLYSTWEELTETSSRDFHAMVRIKSVERRERGWYDVILLPANECRWNFKEGDVAVLSTPRPGTVISKRNNNQITGEEADVSGRVAGTVRRYIPIDTRDPMGATLHFYVGDSFDSISKAGDDHILRKLHGKGVWFLTVLGSLATTQREYIALHAFRRLNSQMQTAILEPSPEAFPKYEEQAPAMPDCFTPNFVDYLHNTFNGPQLAAIQWAATHTAAGTTHGLPWPFTLVQGPPGTGKTHTVWGMLNVIHLVQYQHYYSSLLKKLAPESYKTTENPLPETENALPETLIRTLHKLCPKPRMLVCAPSNAATDELLTRVLDRGFIDGEMKVYRPDVARVGVDSQTRAAQAVSVERRTEQLLVKTRDEVYGWMHQLRAREAQLSQQIASLTGRIRVNPDLNPNQARDSLLQNLAAVIENRDKVLVEISRLFILEGRFRNGSNFDLEEARSSLEASFANEAEVVFTTVSSSGRKLFSNLTHGFDMVVIDEAAQASEVGVLPPLALGAARTARCVLVGDPQQLPATVISKSAGTLLYSRSLFERFQQAGCPTILLSVQYRMHPQIREFPSRYFYQNRLTDSESVINSPDEVYYKDPLLRPYAFYDITHGRESGRVGSVSYQNIHEAQFCLRLYQHLQKSVKSLGTGKVSVGIITPYKLQLKCIQREFEDVLKSEDGKDLYINTVDAFQGQERDVIMMSCVRASNHGVGFVADIRRMNVALTRAKRALWVMGNASTLIQSDDWAALIADAKTRECYMDMDSLPKDFLVYGPPQARCSNMRGLKRPGLRHHTLEDDEKIKSRNGNFRPFKPPIDHSVDDFHYSEDSSRDPIQKRPNSGKRDP